MSAVRLLDVYRGGHAEPATVEFLYELLRARPPEANISHRELPARHIHEHFVRARPYRAWFLVLNQLDEVVGAIYATQANEIGISIAKAHQRKGYARAAIRLLRAALAPLPALDGQRRGCWLANVAPNNQASHALFRSLGARPIQVTYELP